MKLTKLAFGIASTAFAFCFACSSANADVNIVGITPGKAILVVNDAPPKTYAVGSEILPGIKLLSTDSDSATIDVHGKRQVLRMGEYVHKRSGEPRQEHHLASRCARSLSRFGQD